MATPSRTFRYWLQQLHLWVGLILLLPLVMMGITGAVLVYAHDIDHLLGGGEPAATTPGEWKSPGALIDAARTANTEPGRVPMAVRWPSEAGEPAAVRLSRPGLAGGQGGGRQGQGGGAQNNAQGAPRPAQQSPFAGSLQILIDPVSLQVLGTPGMTPWVRFFHDLHGHVLIPGGTGREIVGWLGVAMLVLGCSGLYLWWPKASKWKAAFTIRRGARGLRLHRDLHGATGIWSLVVFMIVNFTGVYIAFPQTIHAAVNAISPSRDMRTAIFQARIEPQRGVTPMGIDEAVALALARVPEARFLNANLALRPDQPLRIGLVRGNYEDGAPVITVLVDPLRRQVLEVFDPRTMTAGEVFLVWQRALHYGNGMGSVWRFLVFLSGVIIPIFAVTGFLMWWIKRRNRKASDRARAAVVRTATEAAE